jgi:hypothetical protein
VLVGSGGFEVAVQKAQVAANQLRRKAFCYQSIGFIAVIAVCMLDELVGLSTLLLGDQTYIINFRQSVPKALIIFVVWLLVARSTGRLLAQVRYLEGFMKVCAWCRRVEHKGEWVEFEKFLRLRLDTSTTHGICQDCLQKSTTAWNREGNNAGPGKGTEGTDKRTEAHEGR